MEVIIETYTVGQNFGTTAQLRAVGARGRKGRVVASVDRVFPYGFTGAARAAAELLAEKLGCTVAADA